MVSNSCTSDIVMKGESSYEGIKKIPSILVERSDKRRLEDLTAILQGNILTFDAARSFKHIPLLLASILGILKQCFLIL